MFKDPKLNIYPHDPRYERLQDNSQELYLVQRAYMIMDFKNRTILPNPFSLPEHCWIAGSWVYRKCCRSEAQGRVCLCEQTVDCYNLLDTVMM